MPNQRKKTQWIIVLAIFMTLVSGLAVAQHNHDHGAMPTANSQDQKLLNELKGIDGKQAMELANRWRQKNLDITSFVTPDAVNFKFKDGKTIGVPLPDDQMVVSIAPYINKTHECATHYMSKCDAELKNVPVKVLAINAGGKTLINKTIKTSSTGFFDLWLPRDREITVSVSAQGKKATGKVYTYRNSKTCDTTLKLE
ncbi:MAG: CueP family metal-binding protein [Smithellaceae bacterium]|nr:CueP family metal-binding protein [Smithellaceae bacterium]